MAPLFAAISLAAAAVLSLASTAGGARTAVILKASDAASFAVALNQAKPGDSIQLADGTYPKLAVSDRRFSGWVSIFGSRRAVIGGMVFNDSSNLVLRGVTISPTGGTPAVVSITGSSAIVLDRLLVDGRTEDLGARINTFRSDTNVTVENSEITNCGSGARCVGPGASQLNVLGNKFHDCYDCDFIRGGGSNVVIRGNSFDRAIRGTCQLGPACNHNDHIQIMGGGPWSIIANRFGDRHGGAASVFVDTNPNNTSNRIHDVLIGSNLFKGASTGDFGVELAAGDKSFFPQRVTVTNNTILSGDIAAVRLGTGWDVIPKTKQPIVADNILRLGGKVGCGRASFISNIVESGIACKGNVLGPARLDDSGAPTNSSTLVINKADKGYDYPTDLFAYPRGTKPDRGAIEYRG